MSILKIKGLVKEYPSFKLGPLDLEIPRGSIVGFIGENGSGKSTTIKSVIGLINKDFGEVKFSGERLNLNNKDAFNNLGIVLDNLNLTEKIKVKEVAKMSSYIYSKWNKAVFDSLIEKFKINTNKKIGELSRGMKMKLSLSIALSHDPSLLILDEATSGLDPIVREEILDLLLDFIQDENKSIFISSHILSDLEKVADYIAFIHKGKMLFFEEKDILKEEYCIYSCGKEEASLISKDAIKGRIPYKFGEKLLLKRSLISKDLICDRASIEEIMIFFIKGEVKWKDYYIKILYKINWMFYF